ncbi:MAG: hypothetical protein JO086_16005 [Acidimicrobiia bacterium]|nr:hypothetical protein [Acidimicrobiia bacterium]
MPTTGPQPSVAAENRNPGTSDWRMPGPAAEVGGVASGPIAGYVAAPAIAPEQTERIFVGDGAARAVRIRVFRIGWYGGAGGREMLRSERLRLVAQPPCADDASTGLTECHWRATLTFRIPSALPSGVYIARLDADNGDRSDCLFVVTATEPTPLLAQLPTSTYEAYNAWGGDSLYPGGTKLVRATASTQGVEVSYERPYDSLTGAGQFFTRGDVSLVRFLERYRYPVSYTDSEAVDRDPGSTLGHRVLLDFGHSEYWSQRQADAWRAARDRGTNLAFLGSDTMAWRVRYVDSGQVIVSYKEHSSLDPESAQPTGPFPAYGAPLTGSAYVGCITPRVPRPGPPTYRYYSWSPSPTLQPAWLYAGTRVTPSTEIPGITGYELDQVTAQSPADTVILGHGSAPCMPVTEPGEPVPGPGQDRADTTLYKAPSGALVFNTGTLGWELALGPVPSASPDAPTAPDPRVVGMTGNLLDHLLK